VIDAQTQTLLREVVRRTQRSRLQYLAESFPWTTPDREAVVAALHRMSAESREAASKIARFLRRNHADQPYLGAFPMEFTNSNFIGLDYALARLVKEEREMAAYLESQLHSLADGEANELLAKLLANTQAHVKELEAFAVEVPATTLR
jgi:hypothetical protein